MVDRFRSRQLERYFVPTLLLVALGSVIISLLIGLQQSVWFDEAYSVLIAKRSALDIIHYVSLDAHPPFYYLLLKVWASVFGWSELALRALSAVAMGGAIVLGGLLVKRMFGVRAALMAIPFVALCPLLLRYGFEIRMYSLASLIGIAATYVLVIARETKTRSVEWKLYALYAMLLALGMYTHYFFVFVGVTHLVWLTWQAWRDKKPLLGTPWCIALVGAGVLFLPWMPVLVSQLSNGTTTTVLQAMTVDTIVGIVSFAFLYQPAWLLDSYGTVIVLFVIATVGLLSVRAFKKASKKERDYLCLLALYLLIPVALIALGSLVRPLYTERYVSHVMLGAMLLVGVVVSYSAKKLSSRTGLASLLLYVVLLLGVAQLAVSGNTNYQRLQKPAAAQAAAQLKPCGHDTTILAADPYVAIELSYYLSSCEIRFYSPTDNLKGGYAPLANSALRIADPSTELAHSTKIQYVYDGKPRLTMPTNMVQIGHDTHGELAIDTFVAG